MEKGRESSEEDEAPEKHTKRHELAERNDMNRDDDVTEYEEDVDEEDEDEDEEEEVNKYFISESRSSYAPDQHSPTFVALAAPVSSGGIVAGDEDLAAQPGNSATETHLDVEEKEEGSTANQLTPQGVEAQTDNQMSSVSPTPVLDQSTTSITHPKSTAPGPALENEPSLATAKEVCPKDSTNSKSKGIGPIVVSVAKSPIPDGFNWRKYGQKQVKSPQGSRSYYRCTYSNCCAKKIEFSDHSGHVIEVVNKGTHGHDPPRRTNGVKESTRVVFSSSSVSDKNKTEHPVMEVKDSDPVSLKEPLPAVPVISDRKRQNQIASEDAEDAQMKVQHRTEPEHKQRVKKGDIACPETPMKSGKKPKLVVHAAGDVGLSGDGYRWRKYGQKMVKGKPHPRNYYRCTSAGCPVRKHIETAVNNTSTIIVTYKGVHDHDMPVPKKRHCNQRSTPLFIATSPQVEKTETPSNPGSENKEGDLKVKTLDNRDDKEKKIESARALLSIGFEIKPC